MAADIVVPEVGESVVDARVVRWLKQPGEAVAAGEAVVELETDKVDVEVAAPRAGVLGRIDHADGADVKVGDVLGVIDDSEAGAAVLPPAKAEGAPPATAAVPPGAGRTDRARATPAARRAAEAHDVDLARVRGSGPGGRIMRRDVEIAEPAGPRPAAVPAAAPSAAAAARPAPSASASQPPRQAAAERASGERAEERVRMSKRRATIARRLVEAQHTAAMLTTFNEADMSAVMALRERHKLAFKERHGVGLGIASFFVKAAIGALREFPRLNAEIQGDEIVLKRYYDIGVAVGATEGLVVPVLRDADRLSFAEIEREIRRFAAAAEDGSLSLADLQGGTFTITNGGVFGSMLSTPILNPPQVGILGLHAIKERPVGVGGQVVLRPMMYLAMTYDHRIVDGAEAVRFLVRVKELVEDPGAMLLE